MKNNIAYMLAVVTMLLFAGCSNEDASDYIHHNFDRNFDIAEVFTASWIVDGNNVGKCKLLMSSEYVGFSNIPYKTICSKVFSEDEITISVDGIFCYRRFLLLRLFTLVTYFQSACQWDGIYRGDECVRHWNQNENPIFTVVVKLSDRQDKG